MTGSSQGEGAAPVHPPAPGARRAPSADPAAVLESLPLKVRALHEAVHQVVVGQATAIDAALYALLSRGHCLLVGVPGLAKTLMVRALARLLKLDFSRI